MLSELPPLSLIPEGNKAAPVFPMAAVAGGCTSECVHVGTRSRCENSLYDSNGSWSPIVEAPEAGEIHLRTHAKSMAQGT